jgi:hypothetical protein
LVSKSTTGSGAIAHRNAIAEVSIGSFTIASSPRPVRLGWAVVVGR